ncbi:hypothetical protein [Sphingorhabdus sp.]|uniref:hypothetical protein n=1 Tax=Sphingorhabdus sp. TaxID=1902408 RepID=UPI003341808E
MPNQMIALQVRNPQLPDPSRQTAQFANMMNMARQQETAQLQGERARQEMDFARAEEGRKKELQPFAVTEAQSKAGSERLKYVMDFFKTSEIALANSRNPQQAVALGDRIKQMFPETALQQSIDETLASIPQDPGQFEAWREDSLMRTTDAKDQLAQEYIKQTTGTEERVIGLPKFGAGAAREVPGSRIQAAQGMQYIKTDTGDIVAVPKETGGSFATPAPSAGAPGKGGVAAALQTNPGALKDGAFAKSQPGYTGASGGFATFDSPAAGAKAQENLLSSAYLNKGFNTINKIINKYAPQGPENSAASVSNYKKYVAQKAGVDINAPISAAQIPAVAKAMREFETGQTGGARSAAPSGPVTVVKSTAPAKARSAALGAKSKYDNTIEVARRLLKNPALDGILGNIQGNIPDTALSLISQDAADALSDYNNLVTIAGFQELQTMRDNSPTGGALGQVSDSENKMLQQSAFASSRTQSEAKFRRSLLDYIARLEGSRDRVLRAYEDQFGERIGGGGSAPAKAATKTPVQRKASGGFTVTRIED